MDHLTHNVHKGRMAEWSEFYERLFNFREVRYFDIEGKGHGREVQAMTSPCGGNIRIPINEGTDERARSRSTWTCTAAKASAYRHGDRRYLRHGRSAAPERRGVPGYARDLHELLDRRLPNHGEDVSRLQKNRILLDAPAAATTTDLHREPDRPDLLRNHQRKGSDGFGEGSFKALFESIELDQMRRAY